MVHKHGESDRSYAQGHVFSYRAPPEASSKETKLVNDILESKTSFLTWSLSQPMFETPTVPSFNCTDLKHVPATE